MRWLFLQQVCIKAGLPTDAWKDDETKLRVFEGNAIHGRLEPEGPEVRPAPRPAGFTPANPREVEPGWSTSCWPPPSRVSPKRGPVRWRLMPDGFTRAGWRRPCFAGWRIPSQVIVLWSQTPAVRGSMGRGAARAVAVSRRRVGLGTRSWPRGWQMA